MKTLILLPLALIGLSGCVAYPEANGQGPRPPPPPAVYNQPPPGYIYGTPPPFPSRYGDPNFRGSRDNDRDGIPNQFDRDRDGDGVPNQQDRRPNNPRQN
jgi:hypothetical protein